MQPVYGISVTSARRDNIFRLSLLAVIRLEMMVNSMIPVFLALSLHVSHAQENVPFIAWSNQKFLEDVPAVPVGTVIDGQHAKSLLDSIMQGSQLVVLFKFNKLSVDDISKYGSVYQQSSNGGSLSNFKNLYENSASHSPLLMVGPDLAGQIEEQSSVLQFDDEWRSRLSEGSQNDVLLVPLGFTSESASSMAKADERMKSVLDAVSQLSLEYTAILTAEMPNRIPPSKSDHLNLLVGRHLLAENDDNSQVVRFTENGCNALLYASMIKVTNDTTEPKILVKPEKWDTSNSNCSKSEAIQLVMSSKSFSKDFSSFELKFNVTLVKSGYYWNFDRGAAAVTPSGGNATEIIFDISETDTPKNFSYHCGNTRLRNITTSTSPQMVITLSHFQIQPFNVNEEKFARAHDCVGFFTEGIWMGLVVTLILVLILAFGVSMLSSLTVMDQFDDPKGKTITVNVSD